MTDIIVIIGAQKISAEILIIIFSFDMMGNALRVGRLVYV